MTDTKPIPKAELQAACRRLCQRLAAALLRTMADADATFGLIDKRLGKKPGASQAMLYRLAEGRAVRLREISDFTWAMGCELDFHCISRREELKITGQGDD